MSTQSPGQMRLFDGYAVANEKATIGTVDIDEEDVSHFRAGETLVLVVVATVGGGSHKANANGDYERTNKLAASQIKVATGVMKDELIEFYNLGGDQLPFVNSLGSPGTGSAGSGTGAVHPSGQSMPPDIPADTGGAEDPDLDGGDGDDGESGDAGATADVASEGQTSRDRALEEFLNEARV